MLSILSVNIFDWSLWIVVIPILLSYLFFLKVRFNHYKKYYSIKQFLKYLIFEQFSFILWVIYLFFMQYKFFDGVLEVNLPFCISLIFFLFPIIIGSARLLRQMNKSYKLNEANGITKVKDYRLPSAKRIDFLDMTTNTIYQLKPNNPTAINLGYKLLNMYKSELESITNQTWNIVLDLY